jgi:hypothetical protein
MTEVTDYPERNTPDYLWPEQIYKNGSEQQELE